VEKFAKKRGDVENVEGKLGGLWVFGEDRMLAK